MSLSKAMTKQTKSDNTITWELEILLLSEREETFAMAFLNFVCANCDCYILHDLELACVELGKECIKIMVGVCRHGVRLHLLQTAL